MVNDTQDVMTDRDTAYSMISELVARFTDQYDSYKKADYNETLTRRDFIDPFFKALGWDIDNSQGYAESYREVIHEDRVKVSGATKAPDYAFRLVGGKRLFFVEAKKPSIAIKDDSEPAYQIRRYGWSAKLPISIITNFEEFAVYDCTVKPKITDKAATARIKYLSFRDYEKEFDFIWEIFSKERVLKGGLDKFVQSDTHKKGTATVDKEFLKLLDEWRKYLATSIALNNKHLNEEELNFAVQQTIDRIIFLRIAEDRGVEPYGALKSALQGEFYKNLFKIFQEASEKYNSSLFDFEKDSISGELKIDNKVIKTIISELYYPESPYEFSVLSVEILGSAYEQFLGKVIRVTPAHHVKIEEKPEVRKAGGVYYTPQYIVEYIVENTVGKLIEGKKPEEISKIKILDPACGSGSFLLGAYQYLLNYHKDYYSEPSRLPKRKKENPLTPDGNLTTSEKKRILTNNIFGVDLDVSAVEVTKLSLLLKCMEGETEASIETQLRLFNERVLPDLDDNIKSGNSLIDTDFYDSHIDFGEEKKINPFNWQRNFPEVFKQGGFDAVIGNPPFVMLQNLERREIFDYALKKFESSKYKIDTYQIFIEQSVKLLKEHGLVGLITPNTFLKNIHSEPLRKFILNHCAIKEILLFNYSVFSQASVDTCIIIFEKSKSNKQNKLIVKRAEPDFVIHRVAKLKQSQFEKSERYDFNLAISRHDSEILKKISELSKNLGTYCNVYFGIQTFDRKKYVSNIKISEKYEPVIDGENIEPYYLKPATEYLNYIPSAIKSGGKEKVYRQGRICIRQIGATPVATFVPENIFTLNTVYNVYLKEKDINDINFILGVINSNTTKFFWRKNHSDEKKTFPKIKKEAICSIPIPIIDKKNQRRKNDVVNLVQELLNLNKEKAGTKLLSKINVLQEKIDYCKSKINKIVYELYGLNEEEIKVIESELEK
jgi:type I restriction-modification system DNA methylase subunit/predicted type IV restriction endonuclease